VQNNIFLREQSLREKPFYNYFVQEPMTEFWKKHRYRHQNVLFICGIGFDPRCTPALRAMVNVIESGSTFTILCARFINCMDSNFVNNYKDSLECLEIIRELANKFQGRYIHEIEVNLFDNEEQQIGDAMLIREFDEAVGSELWDYTDIVVDVSTFPRSMMYTLIGHIWKNRKSGQNLFAVLTETSGSGIATAREFVDTSYIRGDSHYRRKGDQVWVPILGDEIDRMDTIYDFLRPVEVFPLVPFPDKDLRKGDILLSRYRDIIFGKWQVPFENIMYVSGSVPWDVFRKLSDFAVLHKNTKPTSSLVISALAGRAISIGALVAALQHELYMCHTQPAVYSMSQETRYKILEECEHAELTLYWLAGSLYDNISLEGVKK
jgi:hypothetical protein